MDLTLQKKHYTKSLFWTLEYILSWFFETLRKVCRYYKLQHAGWLFIGATANRLRSHYDSIPVAHFSQETHSPRCRCTFHWRFFFELVISSHGLTFIETPSSKNEFAATVAFLRGTRSWTRVFILILIWYWPLCVQTWNFKVLRYCAFIYTLKSKIKTKIKTNLLQKSMLECW